MFVASAKLRMIILEQRPERKAVGVRIDRRPVEGWNMVALSDIWVSLMRGVKSSSPPPPTGVDCGRLEVVLNVVQARFLVTTAGRYS